MAENHSAIGFTDQGNWNVCGIVKSTGFDRINRLINLKSLNEGKYLSLKEKKHQQY